MIQVLLEVLKKATIFMVIGKVILNLGMGKGYEKYIKTVIGFMVVVQLWAGINSIFPVLKEKGIGLQGQVFYSGWQQEMKEFERKLRNQQKDIENSWKEYEQKRRKQEGEKEEPEKTKTVPEKTKTGRIRIEKIALGEG